MLARETVIEKLHKESNYLNMEYGVKRIGLFGSIARDEAKENSDVDLYVEFSRPVGLRFVHFVEYMEKLFNRKVDILTPGGVGSIRIKEVADNIKRSIYYV